jgi:hypothetical protein
MSSRLDSEKLGSYGNTTHCSPWWPPELFEVILQPSRPAAIFGARGQKSSYSICQFEKLGS